jgi:hypothetical protein
LAKKISSDPLPLAVEALLRAAADPRPLKLHGTKASPGIFLSSTPPAKSAAKRCLDSGWLESTGGFSGKGKTAKETYRVTAAGIDFALENAPEAKLLGDLLAAADGQQQTLRHLADALDLTRQAAEAQNKLLLELKRNKRAAAGAEGLVRGEIVAKSSDGAWLQKIVDYVRVYRRDHPHRSCSFAELYRRVAEPEGMTIGQFHDGLRRLSRERKISLEPWTGAMSDLEEDHLALVLAKETKFYADPL